MALFSYENYYNRGKEDGTVNLSNAISSVNDYESEYIAGDGINPQILYESTDTCYMFCKFLGSNGHTNGSRVDYSYGFSMRCYVLKADGSELELVPTMNVPGNSSTTNVITTGFYFFYLEPGDKVMSDFGYSSRAGGGCYTKLVNGTVIHITT